MKNIINLETYYLEIQLISKLVCYLVKSIQVLDEKNYFKKKVFINYLILLNKK